MALLKLMMTILVGVLVKNALPFNPLLTYTLRFHNLIYISNLTGNYTINQYKETQFMNADFQINSMELINKVITTFHRCNPEGFNCEYFQSWTIPDICKILKEKNQIWSRVIDSVTPRFECPIDKNNYKVTNSTIDIRMALAWYPECTDYSWKVTLHYYADDTYVGGFTTKVSFFGYRKRIKSIFRN